MRLRLRLIWVFISSLLRKPIGLLDDFVIGVRILPNDADVKYATNDRHLAFMDLGRVDVIIRAGLLRAMLRHKWSPIVTFATIRYRQPLKLFRKYHL